MIKNGDNLTDIDVLSPARARDDQDAHGAFEALLTMRAHPVQAMTSNAWIADSTPRFR